MVEALVALDRMAWKETLWDWRALPLVSVTIALIATLFTQYQNHRQRDIENLRTERTMVESYLEHIRVLLLEEQLRSVDEYSDARLLARAGTIAVLDGVGKNRKVRVLEFLFKTKLIQVGPQGKSPVVSLRFADLRDTPW